MSTASCVRLPLAATAAAVWSRFLPAWWHFNDVMVPSVVTSGRGSRVAISALEDAEKKVLTAMESASSAFRALSAAESARASSFDAHAETFLRDLAAARKLILDQISALGPDLPFENSTMRSHVEADLAFQQTNFAHQSVSRALHVLSSFPPPERSAIETNQDRTDELMPDANVSNAKQELEDVM